MTGMAQPATNLSGAMSELPLVAILRGIAPDHALEVGRRLVDEGFRLIEVPLNSPEPMRSIEALARWLGGEALIGAGTVLDPTDVGRIADAGGRLVVMPHADATVIRAGKRLGLWVVSGVATPGEAFAALDAGADALKMFPAEALPPPVVKAWRAVLPKSLDLLPVGGITPKRMAAYVAAGATGFGLGSALYKPDMEPKEVAANAGLFREAWKAIRG